MTLARPLFDRRRLLAGMAGLALGPAVPAQFRVEISGVGATQVPIALLRFRDEDKHPVAISAVVRADPKVIEAYLGAGVTLTQCWRLVARLRRRRGYTFGTIWPSC